MQEHDGIRVLFRREVIPTCTECVIIGTHAIGPNSVKHGGILRVVHDQLQNPITGQTLHFHLLRVHRLQQQQQQFQTGRVLQALLQNQLDETPDQIRLFSGNPVQRVMMSLQLAHEFPHEFSLHILPLLPLLGDRLNALQQQHALQALLLRAHLLAQAQQHAEEAHR